MIRGASFIQTSEYIDERGRLSLLEHPSSLPFLPKRVFVLTECPNASVRAEHANSAEQVIKVLNGAVHVDLNNGQKTGQYRLEKTNTALWIQAGVWIRLHRFESNAVILVLSPVAYSASDQFDTPRSDLIPIEAP
jgi:hypothetical protein